jgi:hypothetical protein
MVAGFGLYVPLPTIHLRGPGKRVETIVKTSRQLRLNEEVCHWPTDVVTNPRGYIEVGKVLSIFSIDKPYFFIFYFFAFVVESLLAVYRLSEGSKGLSEERSHAEFGHVRY